MSASLEHVTAHVVGLPTGTSLGDLEGIILPRISGRIVAIGLREEGTATIEFARMADAGERPPADARACLNAMPTSYRLLRVRPSPHPRPLPPDARLRRDSSLISPDIPAPALPPCRRLPGRALHERGDD